MQRSETLQQVIDTAEAGIAAELQRSDNPWLACFTTQIAYFRCKADRLSVPNVEVLQLRVDELWLRREEVKQQYGWDPPPEIRDELMRRLRDLLAE